MGAACTHLDVSPDVARSLQKKHPIIHISDARYETIWLFISPYIQNAVERYKTRQLLKTYLKETPCKDRYLVLHINGSKWVFEITTHRLTREYTELVLSNTLILN